tara:strand:- start:368 stop:538 length:171 start_codon:yes stop_codon:yes gene_type:complete
MADFAEVVGCFAILTHANPRFCAQHGLLGLDHFGNDILQALEFVGIPGPELIGDAC